MVFLAVMRLRTITFLHVILTVSILLSLPVAAWGADLNIDKLAVDGAAAYVLDKKTGDTLYSKNADVPRAVASTTKIMTGMLVLERAANDETVTVSAYAASTGGASIGLKAGEKRSVTELLHALMLVSANDAAVALAEHVAGSEPAFADLMNERAAQLGAVQTRFTVPHGLASGAEHYSSARDLALIARAAMDNPDFAALVALRRSTWVTNVAPGVRALNNSNALLERYAPANGIKTGFTNESGYCLVAGAEAAGRSVIAVVLGSPTREGSFADGVSLLDWSLTKFDRRRVVVKGRRYAVVSLEGKRVPLVANRSISKLVFLGERDARLTSGVDKGLTLPLDRGENVGYLEVETITGQQERVGLVVGRSVRSEYSIRNAGGYFRRVVKTLLNLF